MSMSNDGTHPYYDSKKRKNGQRFSYIVVVTSMVLCVVAISLVIGFTIEWENENMIEVWVTYEAIVDQDKVILYKSHIPQDSMVFKIPCTDNPFKGVECIEKLEYRLP